MAALEGSAEPTLHNEILNALSSDDLARLRPLLTPVALGNGRRLHEPGEKIAHVFFIEHGFASMVAEVDNGNSSIEVGLLGRETMTGLTSLFGPDVTSFNRVMVQMPGAGHRIAAQAVRDSAEAIPMLRRLLLESLEVLMAQVAQTAACNSRHTLSERLARWLLLAHDRADGDALSITQEFLSVMLTVRRSGVTVAMGTLQAAGLLSHSRGLVTIRDRDGLEAAACECYGRVTAFAATLAARAR